jgi:membrane protein
VILGHRGRAFVGLLRAAWIEYERDRARYLAVGMIYYAIVSLIPALLLALAGLGLLLRFSPAASAAQETLLLQVESHFGPELSETIHGLSNRLQQDSTVVSVVSLTGLLLAASVLFKHLRLSFRAIWKYEPPLVAGPVRVVVWATALERLIAFVMLLAAGGFLLVAFALIAATQWLGGLAFLGWATGWLLPVLTSLVLAAITFACMFRFLPPVPIGWRDVALAAVLCAVAWVAAGELFALYGLFFSDSRSAYGALGGLLVVMLWMNVASQMLFFGAEICKVVAGR